MNLLAFGHLETIPGAAHCLQVTRIFRIALGFLTNKPHIDMHRKRRNKSRIAPNRIQQVIAAEYPAWVACQVIKQAKLRGSRSGELTAHRQMHGDRVDDDLFKAEDRRRSWTLEATQHCLDASHQLPRREWLCNVVIGA